MATINHTNVEYGGKYKRGVWVGVTHSDGGGAWERVLLDNDLPDNLQPDYVRVFYPIRYADEQAVLEPTFDARASSIINGGPPFTGEWDTQDVGADLNQIALWIMDNSGAPVENFIFVEYGIEHSVSK